MIAGAVGDWKLYPQVANSFISNVPYLTLDLWFILSLSFFSAWSY